MYSALASGAGSVVTGTLTNMFTTDGNKYTLNSNAFKTGDIQSFASLAGSLTTDGLNYARNGSMTFNVLNASAFGKGRLSGGLLELTIGKGAGLRIGSGGSNVSMSMLASALAGLGEAAKVGSWKYGGIEKKTTLNSINMLSYVSGSNAAKEIWNGERKVVFDHAKEGEKDYIGRSDDDTIHISDTLLNVRSGKETAAQIASLIEHENGHLEGADEFRSRVAGYSVYARLEQVFGITGEEFDTVTDIAYMTEVLKQYGEEGLFTELFFGDAFNQDNLDGDYYLLKVADPGWRQNSTEANRIPKLGNVTDEQVKDANDVAMEKAYQKYVEDFTQKQIERIVEDPTTIVEDPLDFESFKKESTTTGKDDEGNDIKVDNLTYYGYKKISSSDLYMYGCTLSTAAYMAYSITGKPLSLQEANQIVSDENIFVAGSDGLKELLGYGQNGSYEKAVNALAGAKVVEYARSCSGDIKSFLIEAAEDTDDFYLSHIRTDTENHSAKDNPAYKDYHSVLFSNFTLDEKGSIIGVDLLDPWEGGKEPTRSFDEIARADLYKLTDLGKMMYWETNNQGQKYLEISTISNYEMFYNSIIKTSLQKRNDKENALWKQFLQANQDEKEPIMDELLLLKSGLVK